jgi:biofilm PGA synthesis protein PgaD
MSLLIRTQQHWLPRLVDILLTIAAWVGFLSLIYIGTKGLIGSIPHDLRLSFSNNLMRTLQTLLVYVAGGALMGAILLIWAKYNEVRAGLYERRAFVPPIGVEALSSSFEVSDAIIKFLQNEQVWILHNYEHGELSAVEAPKLGVVLPAYADHEQVRQAIHGDSERFMAMTV